MVGVLIFRCWWVGFVHIAVCNFLCCWQFNRSAERSPRRRHCRGEVSLPIVDRSPTAWRRRSQEGWFRLRLAGRGR